MLVIGNLTDIQEAEVAALLRRYNLSIFKVGNALRPGALLQARSKAENIVVPRIRGEAWLKSIKLPDVFPKGFDKPTAQEIFDRIRVRTAYGLTQTTFDDFMVHDPLDIWKYEVCTSIIQYMIEEGIVFADLNPARVFRTPLTERPDLSSLLSKISHLRWLEMFAFITKEEARMFGLGPVRMAKVRDAMRNIDIEFTPGY